VISEMADLVYHCLVLLAARGLRWDEVEEELARRFR
jgi:phosphoribosyl-ATP pyrophosphohydrolase